MKRPPIPPSFRHLAGSETGKKKALLIHGILSSSRQMQPIADALVGKGTCDSVWAYNSWAYWGAIAQGVKKPSDASFDPSYSINAVQGAVFIPLLGTAVMLAKRILGTPSHTIEGAGQEIAGLLALLGWENVTLVGHSLGGLVARCAVEAFGAEKQVGVVVSLGTPHWAWSKSHRPEDWKETPVDGARYLQIVGNDDRVVYRKGWGDFTPDDTKYRGIVKVLHRDLDHGTIRSAIGTSYIPELISAVRDTQSLWRKDDLVLTNCDSDIPTLSIREGGFDYPESKALEGYSGQWVQLEMA